MKVNNKTLHEWWQLADPSYNHYDKETDTEWHSSIKNKILYLAFDGSDSQGISGGKLTKDWRINFSILKKPYKNMPVEFRAHEGFLKKWKAIRDDVAYLLNNDINKVIISGCSQGAAVALFAHEDIKFRKPRLKVETVVFGCPRVFSLKAPKKRWENVTRVQYAWDIVTGMPWRIMGYKHVGKLEHFGRKPKWIRIKAKDHLKYREL